MVAYDPEIIQKFVNRLYRRASTVVITSTIGGVVGGGLLGFVLGLLFDQGSARLPNHFSLDALGTEVIAGLIGALIFGLLAFLAGRERAFLLKLQAQAALCQAKIEENTRKQY
jgi:ABC-type phosphate/phosphonate transport system permease subunit